MGEVLQQDAESSGMRVALPRWRGGAILRRSPFLGSIPVLDLFGTAACKRGPSQAPHPDTYGQEYTKDTNGVLLHCR